MTTWTSDELQKIETAEGLKIVSLRRDGTLRKPVIIWMVRVGDDPLNQMSEPGRVGCAYVTFEPGARTAWHPHPLGQTLVVMAGCDRVQKWSEPMQEIRPGDVVSILPDEKHWHGAAPTTGMTHIAIQETLDGKAADWMEKVSDEQYGK